MNKNLIPNQFDYAGIYVEGQRSTFPFKKGVIDSFMSGMLVPLGDPIRVIPGTKLDLNINAMIRSNTMAAVPLDPMFIDFFAVWIPDRIVWTHQPQFLGENDTTAWTQSSSYAYPNMNYEDINDNLKSLFTNINSQTGAIADVTFGNVFLSPHYGLFNNTAASAMNAVSINMLPFRGYYMAWNHLFRDENYQRPVLFSKTDTGSAGEFGYFLKDYSVNSSLGILSRINAVLSTSYITGSGIPADVACLMPVNKFHDVFTSVLPQPQYGAGVSLPLGTSADVYWTAPGNVSGNQSLSVQRSTSGTSGKNFTIGSLTSGAATLKADLSTATAATINQLRSSVMYQRYLEALARAGRRVPEFYEAIYNVKNTSAACDYPKLLTRARYVLGVNQVVATADSSGSGWSSHLGDTGAYSLTQLRNIPCCEQDFSEFGYLHLFYCVRAANRYSQLIQEHFTHQVLLDEYNPYFDHIGDVGLPTHLINTSSTVDTNFGYAEAWWSERTQLSMANSALNKAYGSLKFWTLGEVFGGSVQTCTPAFLTFDPATLDDIFVSNYYTYPQFIIDALIFGKKVVRMSQHSIPGIVGRI